MSRSAQDVLEFDKLRELLRLRTTCAPGRRVIDGLEVSMSRAALEGAFALISEAREWLRVARELGFGALAEPGRQCSWSRLKRWRRITSWCNWRKTKPRRFSAS